MRLHVGRESTYPFPNAACLLSKCLGGMVMTMEQQYGKHGIGWYGHTHAGDINCNQCAYLETALQQISGDYGCWKTD